VHFSLSPLLRLAAGIVSLAAVLTLTSCAPDAIETYCNANCMGDSTTPPALIAAYRDDCVAELEGAEHAAERVSCDDAFDAYFHCEQQAGSYDCGTGDACTDENTALATCLTKNDPDNVCARGLEHFNECDPAHAEPYDPVICAGLFACDGYCILQATCDDITGTEVPNDLTRCQAACADAQTFGVLSSFEGD
jgi:hypothetical protein